MTSRIRFQPNEEIFAESCSVRYKDLFRAKNIFGVIGTLSIEVKSCRIERVFYAFVLSHIPFMRSTKVPGTNQYICRFSENLCRICSFCT